MTTSLLDLEARVGRALRLDGEMQRALLGRLETMPREEAEQAVLKIERTQRRARDLRQEAERRRREREQDHRAASSLSRPWTD